MKSVIMHRREDQWKAREIIEVKTISTQPFVAVSVLLGPRRRDTFQCAGRRDLRAKHCDTK
jgi:hypothetical protein